MNCLTYVLHKIRTERAAGRRGVYDLELESPSGVVTALMYGTVTVTNEVTV